MKTRGPLLLVLSLLFLPLVTVSCGGMELGTIYGYEAVTGTTLDGESIDPNPLIASAVLLAIIGLFLVEPTKRKLNAIIGGVGLALLGLFVAGNQMQAAQAAEEGIALAIHYRVGFWAATLGYGILLATNTYRRYRATGDERIFEPIDEPEPDTPPGTPAP